MVRPAFAAWSPAAAALFGLVRRLAVAQGRLPELVTLSLDLLAMMRNQHASSAAAAEERRKGRSEREDLARELREVKKLGSVRLATYTQELQQNVEQRLDDFRKRLGADLEAASERLQRVEVELRDNRQPLETLSAAGLNGALRRVVQNLEELERLRGIFMSLDSDGSGTIDENEYLRSLRTTNGVHPAMAGQGQIADSFFAWLKYEMR